jgi:hypothetical protein
MEVTSVGRLAILLLEFADKVSRPVIRSDQLTELYFITSKSFGNFWHIVILRCTASPNRRINFMAHPLLALKRLRGMFKDLAFFSVSLQSRS